VAELGVDDLGGRVSVVAPPVRLPGTLWLHTLAGPSLTGRADVFVGSLGVRPRRLSIPDVLVVHDVTPRTRPQAHTFANRFCFNAYLEESLTSAGAVVCLSEATRTAVARIQPAVARRARVIGAGVDPFFSPAGEDEDGGETRRRFAGGRPYLVQLGTLEPRKGIATLLAAHALLFAHRSDAPDLVLAGGRGWGGRWLASALARHPVPGRVHLPGYVSRDDARALLRHAELVALVSEEEGFGLPLAEALACGAACVTSDAPALLEVSASAALHVARGDAAGLAAALDAALDADAQRSLRRAALSRSAELTWARPLAAWMELLAATACGQSAAVQLRMPGDAPARH
jgi:glycosyltransferase involved in cell wall biosynthesis